MDAPASPSGADHPNDHDGHEGYGLPRQVADQSPMAAEAAGFSAQEARGNKITRVVTPTISVGQRLREIWISRELLVYLVRTEIKVKYKNSALGLVWSMIAPAMTLAIYFVVFQLVLGNRMPHFVIFLFAGLLVWNLFQLGVLTGTGVIVNNSAIVKKVAFPREILALAAVGSALVFFCFQAVVMAIFMVVLHVMPAVNYLPLLLLALFTAMVLACALGVLLSAVNVYLRDMQHLIEVVLTAWFWACPIVYAFQGNIAQKLAAKGWAQWTWVYFLNPMVPLVLTFQRALYAQTTPTAIVNGKPQTFYVLPTWNWGTYALLDLGVLAASTVLFIIALTVFGRLEGNFAEEL
ncbi:MAG TPA: ABC transporter permease [Acidimicrobiales bacterium]|nr:ABC transporter permease [Acidimicrobiales bacterium]